LALNISLTANSLALIAGRSLNLGGLPPGPEGLLLAMCQPSPSPDGMTPNALSRLPPSRARRVGECRHSQAHAERNGIENTVGHVLSQVAGDHNDWPRITAPGADELEDRHSLMDSSRVVTAILFSNPGWQESNSSRRNPSQSISALAAGA
jgi:hypothetical protein